MRVNQENQDNTTDEHDFTRCPDWGKGGHFVVNPETGLRERVQPSEESAPAENTQQDNETKKVASKEKNRG